MNLFETFRQPGLLGLLVVPALLLYWTWTRRGRGVVLPVDHATPRSDAWPRFFLRLAESLFEVEGATNSAIRFAVIPDEISARKAAITSGERTGSALLDFSISSLR